MIFADKMIRLRKKNGWSQEELADRMNVSRQAISKWESMQAVPDIGKMLQLSQLFGVTTDYLLKDEIEDEEYADGTTSQVKKVTLGDADAYLDSRKKAAWQIALATFLCILSPITLLILGAASQEPSYGISEELAAVCGLIVLFILVAAAVVIFILCGFRNAPYEFMEKEQFENEYGVRGMVGEKQKAFQKTYVLLNILGAGCCILSPVPLFLGLLANNDMICMILLSVTMAIAGIGAVLFIIASVRINSMRRLLKEGEFSEKLKKQSALKESASTVFWLTAVAVYLAISFITNDWKNSWIVWPVAGVLYAAFMAILNLVSSKNKRDGEQ